MMVASTSWATAVVGLIDGCPAREREAENWAQVDEGSAASVVAGLSSAAGLAARRATAAAVMYGGTPDLDF